MGFIQFPMRKGWKRVHRLVVLPDYQGVGIGTNFQNKVSEKYKSENWNVNCTTTTPALVGALKASGKWKLVRFGRIKGKRTGAGTGHLVNSASNKRITYSFVYNK